MEVEGGAQITDRRTTGGRSLYHFSTAAEQITRRLSDLKKVLVLEPVGQISTAFNLEVLLLGSVMRLQPAAGQPGGVVQQPHLCLW